MYFSVTRDRAAYLSLLGEYCVKHKVRVLAYCLVTNPAHVVAVPGSENASRKCSGPCIRDMPSESTGRRNGTGICGRAGSFPRRWMTPICGAAIRYVERNPIWARMVRGAENYRWSSAASPCGLKDDAVLTKVPEWLGQVRSRRDWSKWLAEGDQPEQLEVLRRHVDRGLATPRASYVSLSGEAGSCFDPGRAGDRRKATRRIKKGMRPLLRLQPSSSPTSTVACRATGPPARRLTARRPAALETPTPGGVRSISRTNATRRTGSLPRRAAAV